jgi:hypothetical protein
MAVNIMTMFDFITKPINFILDVVDFLRCLLAFIGNIFKWTGLAATEGIKAILAFPFCFGFYLLHAFIEFVLFIIFDVLLIMIFWPSRWLGNALGYPLTIPTNRGKLRKFKSHFTAPKLYGAWMPKVVSTCYSFDKLAPFPVWNLTVPEYGK